MEARHLHRWDVSPAEAREIQNQLRNELVLQDRIGPIEHVAGADCAFRLEEPGAWREGRGTALAGVIVYAFPQMREVERASAELPLRFPYIPGLLSFREIPVLLAAFERLRKAPDVILYDGHGFAHPRRLGIASHLGIVLDIPSIGVAKSVLTGEYREPPKTAGKSSPLTDPKTGEVIGAVLRTVSGVRPVFVSQGHRISLERAIRLTAAVCDGYRIPRPTREADHWVRELKKAGTTGNSLR